MKKQLRILFTGAAMLTASACLAQPTLTQSGVAIALGDVFLVANGSSATYINPGSAGANQTWDLSHLVDTAGLSGGTAGLPSGSPVADSFPAATIALYVGANYSFFTINSSVMQNVGNADSSTVGYTYPDPEDILRFPFTYNDSYSDPWREVTYTNGNYRSFTGTTTVTADGYGTVITPEQTYSNALRVHFVENYLDSVNVGIWYVTPWKYDAYRWYVNGNHFQVAELDSTYYDFSGTKVSFYNSSYLSSFTGLNAITASNSFNTFPDPVSDYLNLNLHLSSSGKVELKIFNMLGAEMEAPDIYEGITGDNRYKVDVQHFPPGIYFVSMYTDGILTATGKFMVSR